MIEFRQQKRAASKTAAQYARVAQMDSAAASEAAGHGFKSRPMHRQSHHSKRAAAFLFTPPAAKKSRCRNQKPQWNGSPYDNTAKNIITYIKTRFFRYLVSIKKKTQNGTRGVYQFVPLQDFTKPWTDEELYAKYGLTDEEINFIESMIKPME